MSFIDLAIKWAGPILQGQARHAITGLGVALVSYGVIQSDQQAQFVSIAMGIVVYLAGAGFSAYEKVEKGESWEKALAEAFAERKQQPTLTATDLKNPNTPPI